MYTVPLSISCAWEQCISVLLPHSVWIESQASLAVPVVLTPRPATSVQLSVMCPCASWSQKCHSSILRVVEYIGVESGVLSGGVAGNAIFPSMYPLTQEVESCL